MKPAEVLAEIQQKRAERTFDIELKKLDIQRFIDVEDYDAEEQDY